VISEKRFSDLLDSLYGAAGDDKAWQRFLAELVNLVKAQNSVLLAYDEKHVSYSINASVGVSPDANALYNQHYGKLDEWYLGGQKKFEPNLVFDGRELCPTEKFAKSEFYNDFLKPHCENSFHECGAVLEMRADRGAPPSLVSFLRNQRKGPFQDHELNLLRKVLPHVQRGLVLHRRIIDLRLKSSSQSWALDQVTFGVVLLHASGGVLFANKAASEICIRARGLELASDGLHAVAARDEKNLQRMIRAAAFSEYQDVPPAVRIAPNANGEPLTIIVTRTRTPDFLTIALDAIVAVFVTDPERIPTPQAQVLSSLFGLTPAENRLTVLLVQGNTLKDSAEQLRVSFATVRSQLMQIFQKTGTSRQSQLISLLLRLQSPRSF